MEFKDLRYIRIPDGDSYHDCYKITKQNEKTNNEEVIWWCPISVAYYYRTDGLYYISTDEIYYGQNATPPILSDSIGDYYANQWNTTFNNITRDISAIYTYDKKFHITFICDMDGTQISTYFLPAGSKVSKDEYPYVPFKKYYTFSNWDPQEIVSLDKDKTVTAYYQRNQIVIDSKQNTYEYDEQIHRFIISAHITTGITPTIEYSHTGEDGTWSQIPIGVSEAGSSIDVYYKITGNNTETLIDHDKLTISEANIFNVTFVTKLNDGSIHRSTQKVEYGKSATEPQLQELDAWVFDGWDKTFDKIYSNLVVTAQYSPRTISCNVYSSLSVNYITLTCLYGGSIIPQASCDQDTTNERWEFINWYYYDPTNTQTQITSDKFKYFTNNGLNIYPFYRRLYIISSYSYLMDTNEKTLIKEHRIFEGYSLDESDLTIPEIYGHEFTNIIPESWDYPMTSDTSLCLLYSPCQYNITYSTDGHGEEPTKKIYTYGEEYTPSSLIEHGYIFNGWNPESITPTTTGDINFVANWEELPKYQVTFINDGETVEQIQVISGDAIEKLPIPEVSKTGYNFLGWFYDQEGTKQYNSTDIVTCDVEIYAIWSQIQFTITFNKNDGTTLSTLTVNYGTSYNSLVKPEVPEIIGYISDGWGAPSPESAIENDIIVGNCTFTAQYKPENYNVTFETNGGIIEDETNEDETNGEIIEE